jgi:hypothetical protein
MLCHQRHCEAGASLIPILFLKDRESSVCLSDVGCGESFARNDVVRKSDLTKQARARDQSGWTDRPPPANATFENIAIPGAVMPTSEDKPAYCNVEQVDLASIDKIILLQ